MSFSIGAGRVEIAQRIAAHESNQTMGPYDRRGGDIRFDEIERVGI